MTRKHFIALADVIRFHNRHINSTGATRFTPVHIELLADFCAAQNPNFDRQRWLKYIAADGGPI